MIRADFQQEPVGNPILTKVAHLGQRSQIAGKRGVTERLRNRSRNRPLPVWRATSGGGGRLSHTSTERDSHASTCIDVHVNARHNTHVIKLKNVD